MAEQHADAQDSDSPTEFGNRLAESLNETFWLPEIERRGGPAAVGPLSKALAVFEPGKPLVTLLNDEVQLVGRAMARRPIEAGEAVTTDDIGEFTEVFPLNVAPDAGWACMAVFPDGSAVVSFDFRRNRGTALERLDRAGEFVVAARRSLQDQHPGPALASAHAAAELAVTAISITMEAERPKAGRGRNSHAKKQGWLADWTRLGNAPSEFSHILGRLGQLRSRALYAEGAVDADPQECEALIAGVELMIDHARVAVGDIRTAPPLLGGMSQWDGN